MQRLKSAVSLKQAKLTFKKKDEPKGDQLDPKTKFACPTSAATTRITTKEVIDKAVLTPEVGRKRRRSSGEKANEKCRRQLDQVIKQEDSHEKPGAPPLVASFGRHIVREVHRRLTVLDLSLSPEKGGKGSKDDGEEVCCSLRGTWTNTAVSVGDVINVLAGYDAEADAYVVDDAGGAIVVDPDRLVSGTSVVSALFCMRKAVLAEKFKGYDGKSSEDQDFMPFGST